MAAFPRTALVTLALSLPLSVLIAQGCAPRASGAQARQEADARFRRTTSIVNYDQAKQAFEAGELDKARKEIESALARSNKEAKYWSLLGRIDMESKRLEKAIGAFGKSIECDPALAEPYYYRGIVYQRWNDNTKAIADYLKAAELEPDRIAYLLAAAEMMVADRKLEDARALLLPKLAYFEHNAAMHELLGDISALTGDYASAARSYERAMLIDPEAPLLAEKIVSAQFNAGEWQHCLDSVRRTRATFSTMSDGLRAALPVEVYRYEGRSLAMLGRVMEARNVFADQVRAFPEDSGGWADLATTSLETGDLDRAEISAERLIALSAENAEGYALRGMVASARGDAEGAVRWYQSACERDAARADLKVALGLALQAAGRPAEASRALAEALKQDPENELVRAAFASVGGTSGNSGQD
ncbi:MAG: tetratricopeptide repeat protein [Phycisphaerales bacterium]